MEAILFVSSISVLVFVLGTNGHKSDQWKFRFFLYGRSEQDGVLSGLGLLISGSGVKEIVI